MDRLTPLFARFEDEKNEELFPVCTSQVARLYASRPYELNTFLLDSLTEYLVSSQTYKRLIAAAIIEKILVEIEASESKKIFVIDGGAVNVEEIIEELTEDKRGKGKPKVPRIDTEELLKVNIATASHETLKRIIGRKENMLFSNCDARLEKKEKKSREVRREEDEIEEVAQTMARNEDFLLGRSAKDEKKKCEKRVKKETLSGGAAANSGALPGAQLELPRPANPTSLPEVLLKISSHLIFSPRWEARHGGLLTLRAFARQLGKAFAFSRLEGPIFDLIWDKKGVEDKEAEGGKTPGDTERIDDPNVFNSSLLSSRQSLNEEIKQRCLLLLALDYFSDFLSDRSNMINRGLAAEVLLLSFQHRSNLHDFANYFDFLFNQKPAEHWQSIQALLYFFRQLIENAGVERVRVIRATQDEVLAREFLFGSGESGTGTIELPENFKKSLVGSLLKVFGQHEEITEMALELLGSILLRQPSLLSADHRSKFAKLTCENLMSIPEISFLALACFEFFRALQVIGELPGFVAEELPKFLRKFLFHENPQVRGAIVAFLFEFFEALPRPDVEIDRTFYFAAMVFSFVLKKGERKLVAAAVAALVEAADRGEQVKLISRLLDFSAHEFLGAAAEAMGLEFRLPGDQRLAVPTLEVIDLAAAVLGQLGLGRGVDRAMGQIGIQSNDSTLDLSSLTSSNSLASIPCFLSGWDHPSFSPSAFVELPSENFHAPCIETRLNRQVESIKTFFHKKKDQLLSIQDPDIRATLTQLLAFVKAPDTLGLTGFFNTFKEFSLQIKGAVEGGRIGGFFALLRAQVENELLPEMRLLCLDAAATLALVKAAAATEVIRKAVNEAKNDTDQKEAEQRNGGEAAPPARPALKINSLVKPLLEALEIESLPSEIASKLASSLFGLHFIFGNQPDSPNTRVLKAILKRGKTNAAFLLNSTDYFNTLFSELGELSLTLYPDLAEIFEDEILLRGWGICCLRANPKVLGYTQSLERRLAASLVGRPQAAAIIAPPLFSRLREASARAQTTGLSEFLLRLLDDFKAREPSAFRLVARLLETHARAFIAYAKAFVIETIGALLEPGQSPEVFELFVRLLSAAGLEDSERIDSLDPRLAEAINSGRLFLFDFQNSKNFQLDPAGLDSLVSPGDFREYQFEALRWMSFLFKYRLSGALCDDMGLGKTRQALAAIAVQYGRVGATRPSLIVVPPSLVFHWERECQACVKNEFLRPVVLSTAKLNAAESLEEARGGSNLLVVSYQTLVRFPALFSEKFEVVVLDEAHLIKNPKSATSQAVKKLSSNLRLALTGTPIQNNVVELWSIFDFLMPGYLGTQETFRKEFKPLLELNLLACDVRKMELTANQRNILESLHMRVLPFIMRREKGDVLKDLPPKIIQDRECEMTTIQTKLYEFYELEEGAAFRDAIARRRNEQSTDQESSKIQGEVSNPKVGSEVAAAVVEEPVASRNFLGVLSKLLKILSHPAFVLDSMDKKTQQRLLSPEMLQNYKDYSSSGKYIALRDLLVELGFSEDDRSCNLLCPNKLLIFTRSLKNFELLEQFFRDIFPTLSILSMKPSQSPLERSNTVDLFNRSPEIKILILTAKIGGLGLNLQCANVVVMFDHDFNPSNDTQAIDRAHRLGQTKVVNVYRLVMKDTLEEKIMGIQRFKTAVSNTVVNADNASIDNVTKANFMENLERFASKNVEEKKDVVEDKVLQKIMQKMDLPDLWDENEYDKDYAN